MLRSRIYVVSYLVDRVSHKFVSWLPFEFYHDA